MKHLSRHWKWFLVFSFICGLLLRVLFVEDMEYKEDEEINFNASQLPGNPLLWPPVGMPTGVYLQNPGLSVWIFTLLGKLIRATSPTELATGLQILSLLGIALVLPFAFHFIREPEKREPWLWTFALALVNPIAVFYQRKLWPEPFLPFFVMLTVMGFWARGRFWGAFVWGAIGALLGQIHMSGFFFAGGFFLWTLLFDRKSSNWKGWFAGSTIGALPLIPWLIEVSRHPPAHSMGLAWDQVFQFKFWVFWVTNPLGLHLGNPLGLLRGSSHFAQLSDFFRYPLLPLQGGTPTYLVGLAHGVILFCALAILLLSLSTIRHRIRAAGGVFSFFTGRHDPSAQATAAALWGGGTLLTLTGANIRRYYTMVNFPFDFVWLARTTLFLRSGRVLLALLFAAQLVISAGFVHYIHINQGATQGDYGEAYHLIMKKRASSPNPPPPPPNQPWR